MRLKLALIDELCFRRGVVVLRFVRRPWLIDMKPVDRYGPSSFVGREHAARNALAWISDPKKTSKLAANLSRDVIREAMSGEGWRTVSIVAIDEVWSALRFRPTGQVGSRLKRGPG